MGPPSGLTPEIATLLCQLAGEGKFEAHAAAAAGITDRVVRKWKAQGRDDLDAGRDTIHARFVTVYALVRFEHIEPDLRAVRNGADGWKGTLSWLEKWEPNTFRHVEGREVSGPEGKPLEVNATARVVVLPPIADERALSDGAVAADAEAGALSREPRE